MSDIKQRLKQTYQMIHQERMQDMPMVNPALSVEVIGFEEGQLGILITPWCMNLMLLPESGEDWSAHKPGSKQLHQLPSGEYEFVMGEELSLGRYQSCSLLSPMFEFADQASAVATAEAALEAVMEAPAAEETTAPPPAAAPAAAEPGEQPPSPSRRAFLRGGSWR